eukprot:822494-Pelagomonas_calceolata.AAC.2
MSSNTTSNHEVKALTFQSAIPSPIRQGFHPPLRSVAAAHCRQPAAAAFGAPARPAGPPWAHLAPAAAPNPGHHRLCSSGAPGSDADPVLVVPLPLEEGVTVPAGAAPAAAAPLVEATLAVEGASAPVADASGLLMALLCCQQGAAASSRSHPRANVLQHGTAVLQEADLVYTVQGIGGGAEELECSACVVLLHCSQGVRWRPEEKQTQVPRWLWGAGRLGAAGGTHDWKQEANVGGPDLRMRHVLMLMLLYPLRPGMQDTAGLHTQQHGHVEELQSRRACLLY